MFSMHSIGPLEIGIVLVVVIIIFGAGKLPSTMTSVGKGIRNFRKEVTLPDNE